jgi:hypothetical protein
LAAALSATALLTATLSAATLLTATTLLTTPLLTATLFFAPAALFIAILLSPLLSRAGRSAWLVWILLSVHCAFLVMELRVSAVRALATQPFQWNRREKRFGLNTKSGSRLVALSGKILPRVAGRLSR